MTVANRKKLYIELINECVGVTHHEFIPRLGKKGYIHTLKGVMEKRAYPERITRTRWYGLVFGDDLSRSQYATLTHIAPNELSKASLKSLKGKGLIGLETMTLTAKLLERDDIKQELASLVEIKSLIKWDLAPRF